MAGNAHEVSTRGASISRVARAPELRRVNVAFLAAQLQGPHFPTPIGVLRAVETSTFESRVVEQIHGEIDRRGHGQLEALLRSGDVWTVGPAERPAAHG